MRTQVLMGLTLGLLMLLGSYISTIELTTTPATATSYVLPYVPFPHYFYGPHLQKLFFTTHSDPTVEFSDLRAGDIDVMERPLTGSQLSMLQTSPRAWFTNISYDFGGVQLIFNAGRFPSNHVGYRRAIGYMIDYNDIIVNDIQGLGGAMPDQLAPVWPAQWHSYNAFTYSLTEANASLYADGFFWNGTSNSGTGAWYWSKPGLCDTTAPNETGCARVDPSNTIIVARLDDPLLKYIGDQLYAARVSSGSFESTYHFDKLFDVIEQTKVVAFTLVYNAHDCGGADPYNSTNCAGMGWPAFTAYTQDRHFSLPDLSWFYFSFSADFLDKSYFNFGHWVNSTINDAVNSMFYSETLDPHLVRNINFMITQQAWWVPIYYQHIWTGMTDRVTGHLSAENSYVLGGSWSYNNWYSYWRAHLKGRIYGGSLSIGIYGPINQLSIFNPDSNWVQNDQVLYRLYDPLMYFEYDTAKLMPGLAYNVTVTALMNPTLYDSKFGSGSPEWQTTSTAPYWEKTGSTYHTVPTGTRVDFDLYANASWHDGSPVTAEDIVWNILTDASDRANLLEPAFATLDDANVTAPNHVALWFNSTSWDYGTVSALTLMAPPIPWISAKPGGWAGSNGVISGISLSSKSSLNLTAAGGLDMLDGSGPFRFDTAALGDPFTTGSTFDLVANDQWVHADPDRASYKTGIAVVSPYMPVSLGSSLHLQVAITDSHNDLGLKYDDTHHDYVTAVTTSDVSDATVSAQLLDSSLAPVGSSVSLAYDSGSGLYKANLTTPTTLGTYYVQITATNSGSISTVYGPTGTSQTSAWGVSWGVSWEGDPIHTQLLWRPCCPPQIIPLQPFLGLLAVLVALPVIRRARRI